MAFLMAFLVGGILCALFQVALMVTKLDVPKLLIIGLALGGIGTAVGFCDWLAGVGGAGFSVMVVGAAQAIFNALMALFGGVWLPICVVIAICAALTVFGLAAGAVYRAMHKADGASGKVTAAQE